MREVLSADDVINKIVATLAEADGQFIEKIANQVLSNEVEYVVDSTFMQELP